MSAPGGGGGSLYYAPEPYERAYYDGLFQAADINRSGAIGGQEAVAFFSRSKLPIEQLKNVWTVADQPPTNSLDRSKFALAIRLIQLLQNGVKGQGANLAAPPGTTLRPVFLEGVSGVSVPLPNQQQQQPPQQQPPPQQQAPPQQQQQQQQQISGPGGSPPPHQGGPSPPQQQQVPPQQQHQQQPSLSGRPPIPPGSPAPGSMALTVQDPYTLTPTDRSRYENLFPQYAKDDGFMHGKEAVALFSKSGLSHTQLRDIWNLVDQPVDNKLDALEFAVAMHLIVCVSKKNLPLPKALPMSLKSLKQQQQQQQQSQGQPQQEMPQPEQQLQPPGSPAPSYGSHPQPSIPEPPQVQSMSAPSGDGTLSGLAQSAMQGMPGGMQTMQGPPPITQAGGMDISDAFAGLSTSGGDAMSSLPPPTSGFGPLGSAAGGPGLSEGNVTKETSSGGGSSIPEPAPRNIEPAADAAPSPSQMHEMPQPVIQSAPSQPPKTSEVLAQSYNMSDATGELEKLKVVLQKLQAENISLKAQLGTMSEEEKNVQREVNATVAEIGELSNQLTTLRAQVLAAKSRLMEATAELKAAQEKKSVLKDLLGEAEATKEAIETAHQGLEASINAAQAPQPAPTPAYEADLFGFGGAGAAYKGQQDMPEDAAHAHNAPYDSHPSTAAAPAPFPVKAHPSNPYENSAPPGQHQLETVSDDSSSAGQENHNSGAQNYVGKPQEMFRQPEPNQPSQGTQTGYTQDGITFETPFQSNTMEHNKHSSISSNLSFEVMGGGPVPQNQFASHPADHGIEDKGLSIEPAPSLDEINEMKSKAKQAEDIARDSEGALGQLMNQMANLRSAADKAEAEARQKMAEATQKKKGGIMGGGKKKKTMKEATKAGSDAETLKKQFLQVQSQVNDAQAVATETRREAERLRKAVEQAELDAAAAASMQQTQPAPTPAPQPSNGYPNTSHGFSQPQHGYNQQVPGGFGGHPPASYGGFNPNVMGKPSVGGIDIPSPATMGEDPYANPFG